MDRVTAFAPATVSNVACGFDVLGFALSKPGDEVTARFAGGEGGVRIDDITGDGGRLPRDPARNTASVAAQALLTKLGERRSIALAIRKGLPLSSGLGGSAASAVAAVVAVDGLLGARTPLDVLMACAFEGERTACIAGKTLVEKYGWKIGDVIPITGTIFPGTWPLVLRGVFKAATPDADENAIFFHWDFVNESIPEGRRNFVGIYWIKIAIASDAPAISARVDALYENSARPTKTETEKAFQAGFISMMGNVSLLLTILGSAIVFAIMLVTSPASSINHRRRQIV